MRPFQFVAAVGLSCLLLAGCGGRNTPKLGKVKGTVTLDGAPLADAKVEFQPLATGAPPSYGRTDASGQYELTYSVDILGAVVGEHQVKIWTERQEHQETGPPIDVPERVPPQYNSETTLKQEVKGGSQTVDFQLEGELK